MDSIQVAQQMPVVSSHSWLEDAYYVSNLVIAVVAISALVIAIFQLRALKRDSRIRVRREALLSASKLIEQFISEILPLAKDLDTALAKDNIPRYQGEMKFKGTDLTVSDIGWLISVVSSSNNANSIINTLANKLEYMASAICGGIADESLAFRSLGQDYCSFVKRISPYIAAQRVGSDANSRESIIELYGIWANRVKVIDTQGKIEELKKELANTQQRHISSVGLE